MQIWIAVVVAVATAGALAWRVLSRKKQHPAGPDQGAVHPLNAAGVAPASGTQIAQNPEVPPPAPPAPPTPEPTLSPAASADLPPVHPPLPADPMHPGPPPTAPEFESATPAAATAPAPPAPAQPVNGTAGGTMPEMHKPGDVFHPEPSDQNSNQL